MLDDLAVADPTTSSSLDTERVSAFARLVDRDLVHAYRLASLLLGSEPEAQDAVQDAAATAWEQFAGLRNRERFEAWFQRILVNTCRDRLRLRGRVRFLTLDDGPERPLPYRGLGLA